jgi:hypothetical protein
LIAKSVIVPGDAPPPPALKKDYAPKDGENLKVELATVPEQPSPANNPITLSTFYR